jgi:hypothetical protein
MANLRVLVVSSAAVLVFLAVPLLANAQGNAAAGANAECAAKCAADAAKAQAAKNPALNCIGLGGAVPESCTYSGPGGTVQGQCLVGMVCQAETANGKGVDSGLQALGQMLSQLMSKLGQGGGGGGGSGSGSGSSPITGSTGCTTSYFYTSDTSQIGSNPCALYQPGSTCNDPTASNFGAQAACVGGSGSGSSGTGTSASDLLNSLTGSPVSIGSTGSIGTNGDSLSAVPSSGAAPLQVTFTTNPINNTQKYSIDFGDGSAPGTLSPNGCSNSTSATCVYGASHSYATAGTYNANLLDGNGTMLATVSVSVQNPGSGGVSGLSQVLGNIGNFLQGTSGAQAPLQNSSSLPGVFGNILLSGNGATIFASRINASGNSQTSGFFGSDTFGSQPQGIAGRLCQSRPWASNFLANVIPASFFDNICQLGGYQVGQPQPQPQVTLQQAGPASTRATATTTAATSTSSVSAQAQIWAVPSAVPLGARTSVFWNTQGVTSCTETSPDGNFSENSLSGAASTVALTGSTTFTISCVDPKGNPVTDYVIVSISS